MIRQMWFRFSRHTKTFCTTEFVMNCNCWLVLLAAHWCVLFLPIYLSCECCFQVRLDDQLGRSVCRICSEKILEFHKFVSTYKDSEQKLRAMLSNATVAVDEMVEHKPNLVELTDQLQQVTLPHLSKFDEETAVLVKIENSMDDEDVDAKQFVLETTITDPIAVKWQCTKCLSEFTTRRLLRDHSRNHLLNKSENKIFSSEKQPQCATCLGKFSSKKMLEKHRREQHSHKRKSSVYFPDEYECDVCNKIFDSKNRIRQHLITHVNEGRRKFLCVACGNQFCSKFGLSQHIRAIHDKEQRFQCVKCDRRFAHKHNLKTHMNRHNGNRPYACNVCTKTFYDSSTLNVHTKSVHSKTNAYVCNICSKGFNRNGNLKIHLVKTHHIQHPKVQGSVQRVKMKVKFLENVSVVDK